MRRRSIWNFSICFAALLVLPRAGLACTAEKMKTTDSGFLFKVVGGSDKVAAKIGPGSEETAFVLEVLAPYYVICEDDQFYKITDHAADTVAQAETGKVGYVLRDQVHPWPTREALNFSEISFPGERAEILVWDDEAVLAKFLDTGNQKIGPPAFRLLKREPTERPLPVLSSKTQLMLNSKEKRVFRVLLPAAVVPEGSAEFDGRGAAIPMAPPDSEKVSRLRSSGANLNVDPEQGGILVREGFILDNEDLLEPEIQVDKKTLDGLITLFSALGAAVVDVDHMKESASRALAIIAVPHQPARLQARRSRRHESLRASGNHQALPGNRRHSRALSGGQPGGIREERHGLDASLATALSFELGLGPGSDTRICLTGCAFVLRRGCDYGNQLPLRSGP